MKWHTALSKGHWGVQVHSTCYKFIPTPLGTGGLTWLMRDITQGIWLGSPTISQQSSHKQIEHFGWKFISTTSNTFEAKQIFQSNKMPQKLSDWVNWNSSNSFGFICLKLPSFTQWLSPHCTELSSTRCGRIPETPDASTDFSDDFERFIISVAQFIHQWGKHVKFVSIFI